MIATKNFNTKFGICSIQWTDAGLKNFSFSKTKNVEVITEIPIWAQKLIVKIQNYFEGFEVNFSDTPLDLSGVSPFYLRVYKSLFKISYGKTTSYQQLAEKAKSPKASRAVGGAMKRNPIPLIIPCHRVIATDGKIGGFSAGQGISLKKKLLNLESKI